MAIISFDTTTVAEAAPPFSSGVYTPALVVGGATMAVAYPSPYTRVGDVVAVQGRLSFRLPHSPSPFSTFVKIGLPVPAVLVAEEDCPGMMVTLLGRAFAIRASPADNMAIIAFEQPVAGIEVHDGSFSFSYKV